MRLICLSFSLLLLCIINIQAQNTLSIEDAVKLSIDNNIELQKQRTVINKTGSLLLEAGRLPNPVFNYSREDLKLNNLNVGEWTASGSLPLNFLWDRWSNIESKEKALEAQKLLLENSKQTVIVQVKNAYSEYHYYSSLTSDLKTALKKINYIAETAKQRVKQGDIPEYELQRILLETTKINSEIKRIEIIKSNSLSQLNLLTGTKNFDFTTEPVKAANLTYSDEVLLKTAIQNRKDYKAVELLIESEKAFLSHNQLKFIPNINLTAGYKKQLDDYSGSIMQLSVEIPLFKRNQLEIDFSENELNTLLLQKKYLENQIREEVRSAANKYKQYKELYESNKSFMPIGLLTTAAYSYEQGEKSLVEFLDGMNAYKDALIMSKEIEINYFQSIFELQKVSGLYSVIETN